MSRASYITVKELPERSCFPSQSVYAQSAAMLNSGSSWVLTSKCCLSWREGSLRAAVVHLHGLPVLLTHWPLYQTSPAVCSWHYLMSSSLWAFLSLHQIWPNLLLSICTFIHSFLVEQWKITDVGVSTLCQNGTKRLLVSSNGTVWLFWGGVVCLVGWFWR